MVSLVVVYPPSTQQSSGTSSCGPAQETGEGKTTKVLSQLLVLYLLCSRDSYTCFRARRVMTLSVLGLTTLLYQPARSALSNGTVGEKIYFAFRIRRRKGAQDLVKSISVSADGAQSVPTSTHTDISEHTMGRVQSLRIFASISIRCFVLPFRSVLNVERKELRQSRLAIVPKSNAIRLELH